MTNPKWFFVSDIHAYHANIIKYCNRPFMNEIERDMMKLIEDGVIPQSDLKISQASAELMTNTICKSINAVVGENDYLVNLGDLLFSSKHNYFANLSKFRDKIKCKNIHVIFGNHDEYLRSLWYGTGFFSDAGWQFAREEVRKMFLTMQDLRMWNIDGQKVVTSHYPMRSWDNKSHDAYMLSGHVHNTLTPEDNGDLLPHNKKVITKGFENVLKEFGHDSQDVIKELLEVVKSVNGIDLVLDVGVDNVREGVPFGTPWSMDDIHDYMNKKKIRARKVFGH